VNPLIGPLTKVIPLKLFLVMVPSSPEEATRAMRGQPKRLSRDYLRRYCENAILFVLISFYDREMFSACTYSQPSFCSAGLSFVLCSFCCSKCICLINFL